MPSVSLLRAGIEAQLQHRIPSALTPAPAAQRATILTGIHDLELPLGGLTEISSPATTSSGRTSLLLSTAAQVTGEQRCCSWIDVADNFDPASAEAAGVELERLLWIRCSPAVRTARTRALLKPIEQAFKAADLVLQAGGFALIVVDLAVVEEKLLQKIPLTTWFRFTRAVEKMPVALVFLTPAAMARSCATLTLELRMVTPKWKSATETALTHATLFEKMEIEVEMVRSRKPPQSTQSFTAKAQWA